MSLKTRRKNIIIDNKIVLRVRKNPKLIHGYISCSSACSCLTTLVLCGFHWSFFPCWARSVWRTGGVAFSHSQTPPPTPQTLQGHEHISKGHLGKLSFLPWKSRISPPTFSRTTLQGQQEETWGFFQPQIPPQTLPWTDSLFPRKGKQRKSFSFQLHSSLSLPPFPKRPLGCCCHCSSCHGCF